MTGEPPGEIFGVQHALCFPVDSSSFDRLRITGEPPGEARLRVTVKGSGYGD